MKVALGAVSVALVALGGFALYEYSKLLLLLRAPGDTPVTVGDGSLYINGSGLNDASLWNISSTAITPKTTSGTLPVARIEVAFEKAGSTDVTPLCDNASTARCDATPAPDIRVKYKRNGNDVELRLGTNGTLSIASGTDPLNGPDWATIGPHKRIRNAKVLDVTLNSASQVSGHNTNHILVTVYFKK